MKKRTPDEVAAKKKRPKKAPSVYDGPVLGPEVRVCGIDTGTFVGMVLREGGKTVDRKEINFPDARGFRRLQLIARATYSVLSGWRPQVTLVEGYGFTTFNAKIAVEVGSRVREALFNLELPWWDVPPSTLKTWTMGKGAGDKAAMARAVEQRWQFVSQSDHVVDAFALAMLAENLVGGGTPGLWKGIQRGQ